MRKNFGLLAIVLLSLVGCAFDSEMHDYQAAIRRQGYVAYYQPVGNPRNVKDWDKFGPGTILRLGKHRSIITPQRLLISFVVRVWPSRFFSMSDGTCM